MSSAGEHRAHDVLLDVGLEQRVEVDVVGVLAGDDDGVEAGGLAVDVLDGDLGLAVGAQVGDGAVLAHLGELLGQPVRQPDRQRHQLGGLVAGVAEHQALVAGALRGDRVLAALDPRLVGVVDALRDVGRLAADRDADAAGLAVEALAGGVVADLEDALAHQLRDVGVGRGGDLAGDVHLAGHDQRLDRDPAGRVLGQQRVEDRVADLVGDLVRVSFGDGLGREQATGHRATPERTT